MGQFRPRHRQLQPDLLDRSTCCSAAVAASGAAHRGPALHHHRDQPGQAHDRGGAGRRRAGLRAAVAGAPSTSTGWRPIRASPRSRVRPTPPSWCSCASTWKTAAAASNCCCPTRRSNRSATCCCRCSWARSSAATHLGRPSGHRDRQGADRRRCRALRGRDAAAAADEARGRRHAAARHAPDALVAVRCGDVTLTEGRMGRVGDRVAIRVTKPLRKPHTTYAMFEKADETTKMMEAHEPGIRHCDREPGCGFCSC